MDLFMLNQLFISLPMLICFFWSVFFLFRLIWSGGEKRVKITLLLFFVTSTVLYTDHWLYFSDVRSDIAMWTYLIANLSVYPLYYAYLRALMRAPRTWEMLPLFLPAALIAVLYSLNLCLGWFDKDILTYVTRVCFAVQVLWVWGRGFLLLRDTQNRFDSIYSDARSYLLEPMRLIQHLLGFTAVISSLLNIVGRDFFAHEAPVALPALVMSVILFSLGYVSAHTVLPQETVAMEEEKEEEATFAETDVLLAKIFTVLSEQKLFADPNMTIQDLAQAVNSNRTYVSQCINRRTGLNFSQFILRYRVEYAKQILRDPSYQTDHEAIEAAMILSGFASNQTFYRVFKEVAKKTPIQYRKDGK